MRLALAKACVATYTARPEGDWDRCGAAMALGNALYYAGRFEEAAAVLEKNLAALREHWPDAEEETLATEENLANIHGSLGRVAEALEINRHVFGPRGRRGGSLPGPRASPRRATRRRHRDP